MSVPKDALWVSAELPQGNPCPLGRVEGPVVDGGQQTCCVRRRPPAQGSVC